MPRNEALVALAYDTVRSTTRKYIRNDGVMRRIKDLCADQKGAKFEYKIDNQDVVGYTHRLVLSPQDAGRLAPTHSLGKQLKHYHPKHARKEDDENPLYHPKIRCLAKKSLNRSAFAGTNGRLFARRSTKPC